MYVLYVNNINEMFLVLIDIPTVKINKIKLNNIEKKMFGENVLHA